VRFDLLGGGKEPHPWHTPNLPKNGMGVGKDSLEPAERDIGK
jgi:hypothetical protein